MDGIFARMDPLAARFREERERSGRTTRELAEQTKIRQRYVEAIELGRYDVLPAVYVRSFIRTLGAALEIPPAELQTLMDRTFDADGATATHLPAYVPEPPPREPAISFATAAQRTQDAVTAQMDRLRTTSVPTTGWRPYALAGAIVVILGAAVWWLLRDESSPTVGTPEDVVEVRSGGVDAVPDGDSIVLTAVVSDTAWVSITMDGTRSQQVVLVPEGDYRWSAMKDFVMSLGNAGAVQFFRNESPLPLFGKKGEAVRQVVIKRKDFTASNLAYRPPVTPSPAATPSAPSKQAGAPTAKPAGSPTAKPVTKPTVRPAVKQPVKRAAKPAAKPATKQVRQQRQRIERPIITPAPPQPIRR